MVAVDTSRAEGTPSDYLRLARFDHATKHVFIIPGIFLAVLLRPDVARFDALVLVLGFASAVAVASANYVINEWLDREFDAHHPDKCQRAAVQRTMRPVPVYMLYFTLLVVGLGLAWLVNPPFFVVSALFAVAGIVYNVRPFRTKDRAIVDVVSESFNNAIRLTLGWLMIDATSIPPSSLLAAFWAGGAFLMNSKRLAEYRDIVAAVGAERLALYRRSFRYYDEARLHVANLVYALVTSFALAVFLIKYRLEYVLAVPPLIALFAAYYALALQPDSVARKPERLFRSRRIMGLAGFTCLLFAVLTFVDVPPLSRLAEEQFIIVAPPS
ncbi:MAG: UbiA family prenyltransferase [Pseudomonadota bacterium]